MFGMGTGGSSSLWSPRTCSTATALQAIHPVGLEDRPVPRVTAELNSILLPEYLTGPIVFTIGSTRKAAQLKSCACSKFYGQAERAISNGKLNALLRLHIRPIKQVVFLCPS